MRPGESPRDCWKTPDYFYNYFDRLLHFEVDAAAEESNKKCTLYFNNGLQDSWEGKRVWCNPPYSKIAPWAGVALQQKEGCSALLLPNRTDQLWFHQFLQKAPVLVFIRGRVQFKPPLDENGQLIDKSSNREGSLVAVFGKNVKDIVLPGAYLIESCSSNLQYSLHTEVMKFNASEEP